MNIPDHISDLSRPILRSLPHRDTNELLNLKAALEMQLNQAYERGLKTAVSLALTSSAVRDQVKAAVMAAAQRADKSSNFVTLDPGHVALELVKTLRPERAQ